MEVLLNRDHVAENEMIDNLCSNGINRIKAEEHLFRRYSYFISMGESKFSLGKEDLFDAYSDTVIAVIKSITQGTFKQRSSLKTYIHEVFHNKCVDLIRKKAARKNSVHVTQPIDEMESCLSDTSASIVEKLISQSEMERIREKMNGLCKNSKLILLLSADGYSDKEIAMMTHFKNADVVKTSRIRGLKKLRQLLS